jgi:protocatechuate 3,4-dioxygenase beta subunit
MDISEAYPGLPMRLAFKIVNAMCQPVAGAKVKVWHTQLNGSYSGATPNPQMCLKDQADSAKHYFRGVQTSDAAGRVDFNSCFPGWYRGRAIHVHVEVTLNGRSAVTQIGFDQALIMELFAVHPDYQGFGQPDTPNATDMVLRADLPTFIATTSRLPDGALMAAKQIAVNFG